MKTQQPVVPVLPEGYAEFLKALKARICGSQVRAAIKVNRELIQMYWELGREIVERQEKDGWGSSVIERLASDLRGAFPGMRGLATRNFWYARSFYLAYTRDIHADSGAPLLKSNAYEILQQSVAELNANQIPRQSAAEMDGINLPEVLASIPWGHNVLLLDKVRDAALRLWYARKDLENGWSRSVLWHQIDTQLHLRLAKQDQASTFSRTLPPGQSDLARELLKDPYNFDFISAAEDAHEREIESALVRHMRQFLLELGVGFMYAGSQYRLVVGGEEFYLDLLFYHHKLRCFVVIELKNNAFKPEHIGKMGFYLTAVDDLIKHPDDNPSIGMILCRSKNSVVAEYAMRPVSKPIGVAEYRLANQLPTEFAASLPSPEALAAELLTVEVPSK